MRGRIGDRHMARQHRGTQQEFSAAGIGQWIGEAIGEGLAQGTQQAFAELGAELAPLVNEMIGVLRRDLTASFARLEVVEELEEEIPASYGHKRCEEPGCSDPALARNLCRRHYARKLYQEHKGRVGPSVAAKPRRRPPPEVGEEHVIEKKLAPVAPIIRRKKVETLVAAPVASPLPAAASVPVPASAPSNVLPMPPPTSEVLVDSVARFFGRK